MNELENKIKELFISNIEIKIPSDKIEINKNLSDYGINSIRFIKLVVSIESEFDIEVSDDDLDYNKFPNLKSLVNYVENKISIT